MNQNCVTCLHAGNELENPRCLPCCAGASKTQSGWQPLFEDMVAGLAKPGQAIIDSLTEEKADLLHMVVGVAGEAGELVDAIKKHVIYNKPVDRDNVVEELGDLEFYMERIRQRLSITRQETIHANVNKLSKRYATMTYSDSAAQQRADKTPCPVFAAESEGGHHD